MNKKEMKKLSLGKNYVPESMSFLEGFLGPKGDVGFEMHFDYDKAKKIARHFKKEDIKEIEAGLDGDFEINSQVIYENNKWTDEIEFFDYSVWANPIILIKFKNKPTEAFECWKKQKYTN